METVNGAFGLLARCDTMTPDELPKRLALLIPTLMRAGKGCLWFQVPHQFALSGSISWPTQIGSITWPNGQVMGKGTRVFIVGMAWGA
jgi:hypothetical protein